MSGSFEKAITIRQAIRNIDDRTFLLPAIQRNFVWSPQQICVLFDSLMREYSTSHGYEVAVGHRTLQFNNTNRLVKSEDWNIGLQKTGYISEAGRCLVMQAQVAGRKIIMVFLDSAGKFSRLGDAERVRHWVESLSPAAPRATYMQKVSG